MKNFLKENWFKIIILIFLSLFLIIFILDICMKIKRWNAPLLERATSDCQYNRVESEWHKCMNNILKDYIGSTPKIEYPYK